MRVHSFHRLVKTRTVKKKHLNKEKYINFTCTKKTQNHLTNIKAACQDEDESKEKERFSRKEGCEGEKQKKWMFVAFKSRMTTKGKTKETNTDE